MLDEIPDVVFHQKHGPLLLPRILSRISEYQLFRNDKSDGRLRDGVCIYVRSFFEAKFLLKSDEFCILFLIELEVSEVKFLIVCLYKPPD